MIRISCRKQKTVLQPVVMHTAFYRQKAKIRGIKILNELLFFHYWEDYNVIIHFLY